MEGFRGGFLKYQTINKLRAVLWLHTLRIWRYKYSFLNMTLNLIIWVIIFILGALMFLPSGGIARALPIIFWGIVMWNIISSAVWLIGGWTDFYLSQGFFEEHTVTNTSSFLVLSFRAIAGLVLSALATVFTYAIISSISARNLLTAQNPIFIMLGLTLLTAMAISYGLIISAISFRIGVPNMMLDIMNFLLLIVGGLATSISSIPEPLRYVALLIPYSYAAELVRYGTIGMETYMPLNTTLTITFSLTMIMVAASLYSMKKIERYVSKNGLKAVGRM